MRLGKEPMSLGKKKELDFGIHPDITKSNKIVPGPGNYQEIKYDYVCSKVPNYTFAKEPRMPRERYFSPGPGSYADVNLELFRKTNPKFSIAKTKKPKEFIYLNEGSQIHGESSDAIKNSFPSPGQYDISAGISKVKPRSKAAIILKSTKDERDFYDNKQPGVGSYENELSRVRSLSPKWSLSKTAREDPFLTLKYKKEIDYKPGVGNYNLPPTIGIGRKVK